MELVKGERILKNKSIGRDILILIVVLLIGFTVPIQAETKLITLGEAIETGIENNTILKNSRSSLEKAKYQLKEAKDIVKPDLSVSSSYTRLEEAPMSFDPTSFSYQEGSKNQYSAGLTLEQPIHKDLVTGITLAEKQVELAKFQYKQSKQQVIYNIIESYYNLLKASSNVEIQEESLKIAREHERVAKARYDAGTVLKTDVLKSTIDKQNVQKTLHSARNQLNIAKKNLAVVIGMDQESSFTVREPGYKPKPDLELDKLYKKALENSFQLEINDLNKLIVEHNQEINDSLYEPIFNVSGNYSTEGSEFDLSEGSWSLTASVSMDLYDGGVNKDKKKQFDEDIRQLKNTRHNLKEEIKLGISTVINTVEDLKETIRIEKLSLQNARENLRIANKSYKAGTGTNLNVIDAQTSYRQSQINLSESRYNYKNNLFKVLSNTGQLIEFYEEVIKDGQH